MTPVGPHSEARLRAYVVRGCSRHCKSCDKFLLNEAGCPGVKAGDGRKPVCWSNYKLTSTIFRGDYGYFFVRDPGSKRFMTLCKDNRK